jgi:murein DD-endopeptidase MepM/ murein hydrolase activator NlpD
VRGRRRAALLALVALAAVGGSAWTRGATEVPPARASSFAVEILVPGASPVVAGSVQGPPSASSSAASGFSYPADGSVVRIATASASASVDGRRAIAASATDLGSVSLFGGEITADAVALRANASALRGVATGGSDGTSVTNLVVLGQSITPAANQVVPLGDWGRAVVLEQGHASGTVLGVASYREAVTGLDVTLTADHGGLPVGARILVGHAETFARLSLARRRAGQPAQQAPTPPVEPPAAHPPDRAQTPSTAPSAAPFVLPPSQAQPELTPDRYVFPVYGPSAYGDSFGAPRADTLWHHGDDIFAPLGAPVLAVTDGVVYSVGWEKIGGNRLWLRDRGGNEFYYAHLSAFSPLAVNGNEVRAGTVLGFVGDTGDAEGTPYHLHFEIHPVSLLFLGYDGVVDPTPYLDAWRHLRDISFPAGTAWAPSIAPQSNAPEPGAILLQSSDISTASGLDPGSLVRALAGPGGGGHAAVLPDSRGSRLP